MSDVKKPPILIWPVPRDPMSGIGTLTMARAKIIELQAEVDRLGAEVEELMHVDYWQDRHNIVKKELEDALEALQVSSGHSNCYCPKCKEISAKYWKPSKVTP